MVQKAILSLLAPLSLVHATIPAFKAYKDFQCTQELQVISSNRPIPHSKLLIDTSITNLNGSTGPAGHWYNNLNFKDATPSGSNNGTGANTVYWKLPKADDSCTFALMKQSHSKDKGWRTLTPLPGDVVLIAEEEGCYYSAISPFEGLITTYCCGEDDCKAIRLGSNLLTKRDEKLEVSERNPSSIAITASRIIRQDGHTKQRRNISQDSFIRYRPINSIFKNTHSVSLRRNLWKDIKDGFDSIFNPPPSPHPTTSSDPVPTPPPPPSPSPTKEVPKTPKCKIIGPARERFNTRGAQRVASQLQTCDTGYCTHQFSVTVTASTALTHSRSFSWTATDGTTVGVVAGVDFIGEGKVTTDFSMSLAQAWMEDTGSTITTSLSNTTQQTITQQTGTRAFLSFIPEYACWKGDADCGKDKDGEEIEVREMAFCQPLMDGGLLSGSWIMVYVD